MAVNHAKYWGDFCPLTQLLVDIIREFGNIVNIWKPQTVRQNPTEHEAARKNQKSLFRPLPGKWKLPP
ncbi:hypothetical protein SUBVAR_06894 [Subdoligranulum variabile DSM 15176]|uniref:Uncharacterized protein n=1 Tax=Subdoligranulum variabile DSM 15176 TaxID=411471 RepID=D1PR66_9FIRM|nr:hypothetical protein SUBVAR_06894 [Subdoligranulum variabile DSM 15176]